MSDIRIYTAAQAGGLTPLTGDIILCSEAFNGAPANSVHLALAGGASPTWKSFANDASVTPPFSNQYSLSFDGTGQFLNGNSVDSAISSTAFSYSVWFKIDPSLADFHCILAQDTGWSGDNSNTTRGFFFLYDNRSSVSNSLSASLYGGGVKQYKDLRYNNLDTADSNWHHFALSCDVLGDSYIAYLDGNAITPSYSPVNGSGGAPSSLYQNNLDLYIGSRESGGRNLKGSVDEIALFNYALTESQLESLTDTSGANPVPANISSLNPSAWWRMGDDYSDTFVDGGSVSSITDSSENGNTATQAVAANQPTFSTSVPA